MRGVPAAKDHVADRRDGPGRRGRGNFLLPVSGLETQDPAASRPISSSELPEIERELQSIVETARLPPDAPAFVWRSTLATDLPVVFGSRGLDTMWR